MVNEQINEWLTHVRNIANKENIVKTKLEFLLKVGLVKGILDGTVNAGLYDLINKKDVLRAPETATIRMELSMMGLFSE